MLAWQTIVGIGIILQYLAPSTSFPQHVALVRRNELLEDGGGVVSDVKGPDRLEDTKLDHLGRFLTDILLLPWPEHGLPLLYVEDYPLKNEYADIAEENNNLDNNENDGEFASLPYKRTRYYRKYPWKRQNSREPYDAENRYLCQPTKEDVFRLLVALHETRQGNRKHTINFCNRKRKASAIFTNIRFLGRRK